MWSTPLVCLRKIRKSFGGTLAVNNVDMDIYPGEVHALVGENGAGKTTLMKILAGLYPDYDGTIFVSGREVQITNTRKAKQLGIALVHQELSLVPELKVGENIFLGAEPCLIISGFISRKRIKEQASRLLGEIGVNIEPERKVSELSLAYRQLVEIAKGLATNPSVLILDEPTSSLTASEAKELFKVIKRLIERKTAIIYISHKLDEVFEISNRITVLRDGIKVATDTIENWDKEKLVRAMVGRELDLFFPHNHSPDYKTVALELKGFSKEGAFKDISFKLHKGEVLGIYGLIGAGRSELAEAIFGLSPYESGEIKIFGENVKISSALDAISLGIALVPEDRRGKGLVLIQPVLRNLSLAVLRYLSILGFVKRDEERKEANKIIERLAINCPGLDAPVFTLSGGNQQKVVIGKWLIKPPRILILDEPTRGIDVFAKQEVHSMIDKLAQEGIAILLISSELPEVLGMSDRIVVMREGEIAGEFQRGQASAERVGSLASMGKFL